jgi:hypothetical protein
MNRKQMIEELTMFELEYLLSNDDKHTLSEVTDFFAEGGFNTWTDEKLEVKYNELFGEE